MSFQDCARIVVHGDAINTVSGNQYNINFNHKKRERDEYDEYKSLRRGDVYLVKEIHRRRRSCETIGCFLLMLRGYTCQCSRTLEIVYSVTVDGRQNKFTAIQYEGEHAQQTWEEDFCRFSQERKPDKWQLYGLNRSRVPFLIFHDELVPLGHFHKHSFWGDFFVVWLKGQMGCRAVENIWLNSRGALCEGSTGPSLKVAWARRLDTIHVPPLAEMLKDDVSFQFFQKFASTALDRSILQSASSHAIQTYLDNLFPNLAMRDHDSDSSWRKEYPCLKRLFRNVPLQLPRDILNELRFDTVYSPSLGPIARWPQGPQVPNPWSVCTWKGLTDPTRVDKFIRFKLDNPKNLCLEFDYEPAWDQQEIWLSQSSKTIDVHGLSARDEQLCFVLEPPGIAGLVPARHPTYPTCYIRSQDTPIYLFLYRPPMSVSELMEWKKGNTRTYFWSLDEDGHSKMSMEECRQWGVPELESWHAKGPLLFSWPSDVYTALRKWQVARGFDPSTTDFAQSLGFPELEILGANTNRNRDEVQFEVIDAGGETDSDLEWELVTS